MELELRHLRLIITVAEQGSVTRAATALGLPVRDCALRQSGGLRPSPLRGGAALHGHKPFPCPLDCRYTALYRLRNVLIPQPLLGLEQNPGSSQFTSGVFATADHVFWFMPLFRR